MLHLSLSAWQEQRHSLCALCANRAACCARVMHVSTAVSPILRHNIMTWVHAVLPAMLHLLAAPLQEQQQDGQRDDPETAAEKEALQLHTQQQWQMGAALTVDSCMIAEVLQAEEVPQLLRYFCCQHNMGWLEAYKGQGVDSELEACIAKGHGCCRMAVTPSGIQ